MPTDTGDFDQFDEFDDRDQVRDDPDIVDGDDFDDDLDDGEQPRLPWPPPPGYPPGTYPPPPGGGNRTARRVVLLAVTAVVAALAGFGVVVAALHDGTSGGSPGASAGSSPSAGFAAPGSGTQTPIPMPAGPGQQEFLEIGGKVMAVNAKSITIGGPGQSVTAAVTAATKVTGRVSRIGGVKVGDFVAVSITGTDGKLTADSIQDPASMS
jgi:hypothetical protein